MQVAVDDQHVYFSRYGPDWIGRTDLDGENDNLDFLSTGVMNPVGLALAPAAAPSSNADLAGLSLTEGALAFSPCDQLRAAGRARDHGRAPDARRSTMRTRL